MRESEHDKIRQRYTPRIPYQQQDKTNGAEVQSAIDYIQKIKMIYTEQSPIFMKFLEAMKDFKMTKISGTELYGIISKLFADKPHLINEFKSFIPPVSISNEESKFVEKINKPISSTYEFIPPKIRLKEREVINKFVDLLYHLKKKPLNPQKVNEFNALLNEYPEIISKLNKLTPAEKEEVYSPFDFITEKIKQLGIYKEFMKCINSYNQNLIGKEDLVFLVKQIIKEEKLLNEFIRFLNPGKVLEKEKKKYFGTVGSYRIIKDEPGDALINDYCVGCPTHNREDENYVFLKRNIFEENLFRIEDERYEIDLLCLRIELLIISLEKITLTNLEEIGINQLEISSGIVQSILELIYKENYSEVLEGILSKPKETIPVVLNRLYRVNERIKREKIEKEKIWEEATKLNYYKALDNIYFDFKSTDKKELLFKNLSNTFVKNEFSLENLTSIHKKIIYFYQLSSGNNLEGIKLLNDLIEILNNSLVVICVNNTLFSIICYLIILTQRLSEIFTWELKELNYGKMNRELGLIDRMDVEDRIKEIFITIENLLEKKLDSTTFDEEIRILTDNKGYKLFSIDKIFSKLDNKVISVLGDKNIKEYFDKIYNFIITNINNSKNININNSKNINNIEQNKNINIEQNKNINNELNKNINNEGNNELNKIINKIKNEEIIDGKSNTNINNESKNEEIINNEIKNETNITNETNNEIKNINSNSNESNIIDKYLNNSLFKYSLKLFDEIELEEYFIMELIDKSITFHKIERKLVKNEKNQIVNKIRNLDFDEKNIKSKVFLDRTLMTYNEGIYQLDLEHRFCFNTNTLRHIAGTHDFFMRGDHKRNNKK